MKETRRAGWPRFKSGDDQELDLLLEAIRLQTLKSWGRVGSLREWPGFVSKWQRTWGEHLTHVYAKGIATVYEAAAKLEALEGGSHE